MFSAKAYSRTLACGLVSAAVATPMLAAAPAWAQSIQSALPAQQVPSANGATNQPSNAADAAVAPAAPADPYARLDALGVKGWITPYPKVGDTIFRDDGGVRSALADAGFGFQAFYSGNASLELTHADRGYHGPQVYNGQRFTVAPSGLVMAATYDLGRLGDPGAQLIWTSTWLTNSFTARNGPRGIRSVNLSIYQPLFGGRAEVKAGFVANQNDFMGLSVGGSLASGTLGPQAVIPFQVGMSYGAFAAPTLSVKLNWSKRLYTRTAVQRSLAVGGGNIEFRGNPTGLHFMVPGAKPLVIQEIGYKRPAEPGSKALWIRGGGLYNSTLYPDYRTGRGRHNWAAYLLADAQLTQPDPAKPARGLYVGGSIDYAPPGPNLYSRYGEARIYMIGPFANRPFDLASFVATYNGFSRAARDRLVVPGGRSFSNTQTYIGSYSYRVMPGLYLQPGLGVVVHPAVAPRFGTALNTYLGLVALF